MCLTFFMASQNGDMEVRMYSVVQLLIQRNADVNIRRKVQFFTEGLCMCVCL